MLYFYRVDSTFDAASAPQLTTDSDIQVQFWRPSWTSVIPHWHAPILYCLLLWLFERVGVIKRGAYGALIIYRGQKRLHVSLFLPKLRSSPFMGADDLRVKPCWSDPKVPPESHLAAGLREVAKAFCSNSRSVWYITSSESHALQRAATVAGYILYGLGAELRGFVFARNFIFLRNDFGNGSSMASIAEGISRERAHYEHVYATSGAFANEHLRQVVFGEAEKSFREYLGRHAHGSVLEIGCGTGEHSVLAASSGASHVVGCDLSASALALANQRAIAQNVDRCSFEQIDAAHRLSGSPGVFSLVIDHESLASFERDRVLTAVVQGLDSSGNFIGIESLNTNPVFRLNRYIGTLRGRRTRSEFENAVNSAFIAGLNFCFREVRLEYYYLFAAFLGFTRHLPPRLSERVSAAFKWLDSRVLSCPLLKPLAFKVVFRASGPRKELLDLLRAPERIVIAAATR